MISLRRRSFSAVVLLISLSLVGAGCKSATVDYFQKKQACAEYIPKIKKALSEDSSSFIIKQPYSVCFSLKQNTCLSFQTEIFKFDNPQTKNFVVVQVVDALTGEEIDSYKTDDLSPTHLIDNLKEQEQKFDCVK